jgi:glutamate/tyrosine decarboxylase-like PLP-dependent enzyme
VHQLLAHDLRNLPGLLEAAREAAEKGLGSLDARPVVSPTRPEGTRPVPKDGVGGLGALAEFAGRWEPGCSGSAGPRYLGFVTGGATPASVAGDWLASAYDQNACDDDTAADLEHETLGWLREAFGLGTAHQGTFVSGATMSNTVGLAIAREWLGERAGVSVARHGTAALGRIDVLSGTPHASIYKALSMLGIGRDSLRTVPVLPGREAVDVTALTEALEALDGRPAIVVANAGTVNTVDFDDIAAIAALRERYPFWLHVDAAFGGFAALSPEHAHLVAGLDEADSVCVDLHKWLNVPYDSAVQFTRRTDLQVAAFHNTAAYLGAPGERPDLMHLTPENSRRLRALAAWFTLTAYGLDGHREIVERDVACARLLGEGIETIEGLRLLAPVRLNVVCFTVSGEPDAERVEALRRKVADSGEAFLTPTVHDGLPALRAAFSNWRTGEDDVRRVLAALRASV